VSYNKGKLRLSFYTKLLTKGTTLIKPAILVSKGYSKATPNLPP
jgi:hypothetical protein